MEPGSHARDASGADSRQDRASAWAVGDAATLRGFALAGFRVCVAEDADRVLAGLETAGSRGATLVVLTEAAARLLEAAGVRISADVRPVVTVLPSLGGERREPLPGAEIRREVRRALGIPTSAPAGRTSG